MKRVLFAILSALLMLTGCSSAQSGNSYRQISMKEAVELMQNETGYIILDVRTYEEYEQGHIPGAICLPNENIHSVEPYQLPDKDQMILVYCRSGNRSKQASEKLAKLGYSNIIEFGGIIDWSGELEYGNE